jgi:prepilin-type N-terminal cleavage/methylation domain-containing protein
MQVRKRSGRCGLTVVELMATLAVLGILLGGGVLAWPRIAATLRLESALHQLSADLAASRVLAVAAATRTRVTFARGATSYRLERAGDDGTFRLAARRALPDGVRVDDVNSGGDLVFSARGNAENGTVVLGDERGVQARVILNQRGRVTITRAGA